ncbi:MAG TPA: multicopper oxidase domain-containing protein [Thermoanaerobaculia bacterium]|nr:multicopper oxidase domain-containing protein [Thermoanaerobaculia bacterium]
MPEVKSKNGRLAGVLMLSDEQRSLAESSTGSPCASQRLRLFKGWSTQEPVKPWPSTGDILPGPTLRARVGEIVQLTFLNQINQSNFPNTLDQDEQGKTDGCDVAIAQRQNSPTVTQQIYPRNDKYPNCLHGSSTANVHFHGTHTTPSTTGDNVLLYIRPALRKGGELLPNDRFVNTQFDAVFRRCEAKGSPQNWSEMPPDWQAKQKELLQFYDSTAPYKGVAGALPEKMKLWPRNQASLDQGKWPQYSVGAYPYCFELPKYDPAKVKMGQSPGTHWYHAHKHGSTALNVGNGMTGAFIIEGEYDDVLRSFYKETASHKGWGLQEQVLMIQQLETAMNLLSGTRNGGPAPLSVNGRLNPVVTMKPNQVQLWRVINGAPRTFVEFHTFKQRGKGGQAPSWRQIAQDGVQFSFANYDRFGTVNAKFNLATANRADLLVKAPALEGDYALQIVESVSDLPSASPVTLLTVRVKADGTPIQPPMDFITEPRNYPVLPPFLKDITGPFTTKRELMFNTSPSSARQGKGSLPLHEIDGHLFNGHHVDQPIFLDAVEEWTIANRTTDIAHPFHIHVNPFQITEVFQPNSASAKDPTNSQCYADPAKPDTWKPCVKLTPPFVWWDVFAIPTARADALPAAVCTELEQCPPDLQQFTDCEGGTCTVTIPGYFKMRSRFVDYTGQFVLHCHILAHEDRGMMQLVEVLPKLEALSQHH